VSANKKSAPLDYSQCNEQELVGRFRSGDEAAFEELFKRYKSRLVHVAERLTGDHQASEEIAHEVFLEIYQHMDRFRAESRLYTYLYRITCNRAKNVIRSQSRKRETSLSKDSGEDGERLETQIPQEESIRKTHDKKELTKLLQKALNRIPETARQAFVLTEIEELSYDDVAKTLGISKGAVGWHIFEARKRLRKLLPGTNRAVDSL